MMRPLFRPLLVAAALLALPARAGEPFGRLTIEEVAHRLGEPTLYLFDVNSKDTFKRGHVPHARWLPYDKVTATDLPRDKEATLVFYCANPH
jgi:rhodanese-related sulfurtransferase